MTIDTAVMIMEDTIVIMAMNGIEKEYIDQIVAAMDTIINALPDNIKNTLQRNTYLQ